MRSSIRLGHVILVSAGTLYADSKLAGISLALPAKMRYFEYKLLATLGFVLSADFFDLALKVFESPDDIDYQNRQIQLLSLRSVSQAHTHRALHCSSESASPKSSMQCLQGCSYDRKN